MTVPSSEPASVVVRLGVSGALGEMDFPTVLRALAGSYELLRRTAHRVLGDRAAGLTWQLSDLRGGSAMTLIRAAETEEIREVELREIVATYTRDLANPAERLPEEDVSLLRELLVDLQRHASGGLLAQADDAPDETRVVVEPETTLAQLGIPRPIKHQVTGSVSGRLESLNVHGRREAALWNELDQRRVIISFPETFYARVHGALRQRVEAFGILVEDADGRPLRLRLEDLELLASDEDLPSLSSLVGSMPDLVGDESPEEYLANRRREFGLG